MSNFYSDGRPVHIADYRPMGYPVYFVNGTPDGVAIDLAEYRPEISRYVFTHIDGKDAPREADGETLTRRRNEKRRARAQGNFQED